MLVAKDYNNLKGEIQPVMYKRCICGKFFETLTEKRKYCNDKCRPRKNYYTPKPKIKKICKQCGIDFSTGRSDKIFCTDICKDKYYKLRKNWTKKLCPNCGETFSTSKSYQVYCNPNCYKTRKRKRDLENIHRIRKVVINGT